MTLAVCPFCGPRPVEEFEFRQVVAEGPGDESASVYLRVNTLELSVEHWRHAAGCRAWLEVRRNPSTGEVLEARLL